MPTRRINFILAFLLLFGAVVVGRLFYLQIVRGDFYRALARGLHSREAQVIMERGEIFFRDGESLAINIDWPLVFASPLEVKEKEITAAKLAEILSLEESFILDKLEKNNLYEPIKKRISYEEIQKITELNLKGIYLGRERGRYYPQETLASRLVGFLDADLQGQYGIEGYYNEILQENQDIFLTIDYSIQFKSEKLLEEAKANLDIKGGQIIVMDSASGAILALANFPNFNPNQYSAVSDFKIFKNGATQKIFEPGSIFKAITMAGALEEEKVAPQTTFLDKGMVKIEGWPIHNYGNRVWGERTMTEVLERSINTGAVFAGQQLGYNLFLKYIEKLGILTPTGIDMEEINPLNREFREGRDINLATASFGQGIEMTPVQLMRAFSAIANNGYLTTPFVVKQPVIEQDLVFSPKTVAQLTAMLVSVTENGFARSARVPGYYIAGKTGTAQMSYATLGINKRGYSNKTWQSFIGFAPAFDPRFLILVKLDNPRTRTAEYSAVPIFRELARFIINYYQIPPDY